MMIIKYNKRTKLLRKGRLQTHTHSHVIDNDIEIYFWVLEHPIWFIRRVIK